MQSIYLTIVLAPLLASVIAGLFGRAIGKRGAHSVTILGVGISCALSLYVLYQFTAGGMQPFNATVYTWMVSDGVHMQVGFLIDRLTAMMMAVVTFVSLMVHIYTIGYMHDDDGYQRFFCYISLFTFSMLMLVMANNFMQLFFGWEAVGMVSYLLIGFWYTRPTAIFANLKAFLVNRVGDFGFVLGIAAVLRYTGSLDYATVFAHADQVAASMIPITGTVAWPAITFTCICLFIGAMGKSAQVPLHIWLPDSMEGPTPISALIHAATMVTAGIFMVARMSPLFELSESALSFVLFIGATTAFFMGLLGIVANDIKRVIAYSTLSQLGYMTVALGASAYGAGIFHLMTHAFFKALLFLAAGSVIMAMHHEQDMRKMGGLRKYLPVTYWTCLVGCLALIGFPGTSGFFSKDLLIDAVAARYAASHSIVAGYAYFCVLVGVFITALYTFRMFFMTFHGKERMDHHTQEHLHESPWVVTVPLILLAIPSAVIGWLTVKTMLFGDFFEGSIHVAAAHNVLEHMGEEFHGSGAFVLTALTSLPLLLAALGVFAAWLFFLKSPALADKTERSFKWLYTILVHKYGFDWFNEHVIMPAARMLGGSLWRYGDQMIIDDGLVNGSARTVGWLSSIMRYAQSGYLYHYAFAMILGLASLLSWLILARMMLGGHLLSLLIWLPIIGGFVVLGLGRNVPAARWLSLGVSVLTLLLSIPLWTGFKTGIATMQFVEEAPWITTIHSQFHIGVDGISMPLILLTTFTTVLIVISSWVNVAKRVAQYFAAFLILEGLMIGVFAALDGVLFYVFWEAMLIPMFIIIGVWGGPRRVYATIKFFLYTFIGSLLMLVALIYMYLRAGTYELSAFQTLPLTLTEQTCIFLAFFAAFAVKVPMWPVHTWLPDAHVEAPTGGSVVLAAIMLKMGGYGFLRFSLPIAPDASRELDWLIISFSLIAVVYIGFVALAQRDMKKLIAYSSIAHMGFVTLGMFIGFQIVAHTGKTAGVAMGIDGAVVQMLSHGFVSGAMFLCVGVLYDRVHSREISDYGGVINTMPAFAAFMVFFALANSGLPGTSGFVGEFLVILASLKANVWYAFFAGTTLILGAAYSLWLVKRVIFGEIANDKVAALKDLNGREFLVLGVLAAAVILLGVWPAPLLDVMRASTDHLAQQLLISKIAP